MLNCNAIRPQEGETAAALLQRLRGKFLLLNVTVGGNATSVCVNVESGGSVAWRIKEENKRRPLKLDLPAFDLTDRTLVLSYEHVNALANNFQIIFEAMPSSAVTQDQNVSVGILQRDRSDMGNVLAGLEQRTDDVLAICCNALDLSIDTELLLLRRELRHSVCLMNKNQISDYGCKVLSAFADSQRIYAALPQLRGYGTENTGRSKDSPNKKDAQLRFYMERNRKNPLGTKCALNFVAYELKPLNISDTLKWNCSLDIRTDSVDLLMSLDGRPVITEVKMAGDKFVSAAVVQLLYYASIIGNPQQMNCLTRNFDVLSQKPWLCVIAESRADAGFASDLDAAVSFLRNGKIREVLRPFFDGAAVIVIERGPTHSCGGTGSPSFRVVEGGEHFIAWQG